ncbi:Fic/DOC family N-terminal domain-containing protein [Parafilimonas sp.]|uniref:Fic/DOC family N-terminal domain-containing protein n=1 Tax=Parafilimonas sp. TaxID=1969739 RepID=UPI0039E5DA7D
MSRFDRKVPYSNLPLLPLKANIETKNILRKSISADRALAQFNDALLNLPNPNLFSGAIYLQATKAGSVTENIITTNDKLYKSLAAGMNGVYSWKRHMKKQSPLLAGLNSLQTIIS